MKIIKPDRGLLNNTVYCDFETRSRAKLTGKDSVGSWRYASDPSTTALCLSYAFNNAKPNLWVEGQPQPLELINAFKNGWRVRGWNAMSFERAVFECLMKTKYGWVVPDRVCYHDTMLDALSLALPAGLEACGAAIGLPQDLQKDKEGKRLIQFLCKPITSGKKKGQFRERNEYHKEYAALYSYCKQDVIAERAIHKKLPYEVSGDQRALALLIMRMNERGIPVDVSEVRAIHDAVEEEKELLKQRFFEVTGVDSPTQTAKFLTWLQSQPRLRQGNVAINNVQAETLRDLMLEKDTLSTRVLEAITLTQQIKKTSVAKYKKILEMVNEDGTVKNNFIYHKANTGRLAGAGFQAQNLPGASEEEPEPLIECFVDQNLDFIRLWRGVIPTASRLIRSMIKAPKGMKILNGDLKGIEARGSMWVAEEWDELELIRQGHDPYKITAANMYRIVIEAVDKIQRAAGKISVLSGGFGGGYRALLNMAKKMGMPMDTKTAKKYNREFREGRPKLVSKWEEFGNAAKRAVMEPGIVIPVDKTNRYGFFRSGDYLYMILPSKRLLSFPFPRIATEMFYGKKVSNVSAMWVSSYTHKWERRTITGANFFQSAVQATCCDILMEAHLRVERAKMPLFLSVHDEGNSLVPDDARYTVKEYENLMTVVPEWAEGFPIDADCWEGYRFKK